MVGPFNLFIRLSKLETHQSIFKEQNFDRHDKLLLQLRHLMSKLMTQGRGVSDSLESMTFQLIRPSPIIQPHPQETTENWITDMTPKVLESVMAMNHDHQRVSLK